MVRPLYPIILGPLTVNTVDTDGTVWLVQKFGGWSGEPESYLDVNRKPRQGGAWAGDGFTGERVMPIGGLITARTPALLNAAIRSLKAAVTNAPFRMEVSESGEVGWCMAQKQGETLAPRITDLVAQFSIQVVALDPRKLGATVTGSTRLPSTTGGLAIPYTIPYSINAAQVTGQISLRNTGNVAGPIFGRIDGPCVGPVVTHGSQVLSLPLLTLGAGEWLDIDFEKREVLANGQASRNTFIGQRGWSTFEPGPNTWSFTAASYTPGAQLSITAVSADK
ncbi:hypothetical protein E3T26_14460 [Cryobacterium sp. TMT1-21]|uniref:hypothetical protein n=1 Tax=Cryobacterium sp. TMT1-21 TaxID=1259234 RepID=UPI00106D0140|nr:hypothetical protein [Cryobacterium sp. TMT1-21]TFD09827.1 hypothetical protein E3T26_14460 [Cryobacterium sp. TMT1-21]